KAGAIRVYEDGGIEPESFLSLEGRVLTVGEQGLLSLAFPPDFPETPYVFVTYSAAADSTATPPNAANDLVLSRFTVSSDQDVADPASERRLLVIPHSEGDSHYGGQLQFGPDGYLYVSTGAGRRSDDQYGNPQNPDSLLAKVLRIDPLSAPDVPPYFVVPPGNPFPAAPPPLNAIWSYGLRNPWRFSFDRVNGDLAMGDVGQNTREEI